ncbi:MAG TPA: hypothetical protein ENK23_04040 [Sorangium sp.]|nr:hypothetical protein [Sorangium sp.]
MVSGAKNITAIASENMLVSGASTLIVGGSYLQSGATASVSVGGASSLTVGGALSYAASKYALSASIVADTLGSINLKSAGPVSLSAGGRMNLTLGDCALQAPTIVIKAKAKLTLRGGGATIQMTPASITFTGPFKAADPDVASGMVKHK